MPIYVRAGAIVPLDPVRQFTSEAVTEPTQVRVYPGANGEFTLYDDDGVSQAYLNGAATCTRFLWNDRSRVLTIAPDARFRASTPAVPRTFDVVLQAGGRTQRVHYAGRQIRVAF